MKIENKHILTFDNGLMIQLEFQEAKGFGMSHYDISDLSRGNTISIPEDEMESFIAALKSFDLLQER